MTEGNPTKSSGRTLRAAAITLALGILLAVAGWGFAQDKPATPAARRRAGAAPVEA